MAETFGESTARLSKALVMSAAESISYLDRLRLYASSNANARRNADPAVIHRRATYIPQAMWPTWTMLLAGNRTGDHQMIRASLSCALLLPGSDERRVERLNALLDRDERFPLRPDYFANGYSTTGPILRALCRIADYLDENGSPINCRRRRRLKLENALWRTDWDDVARPFNRRRERDQDFHFANSYLWERVTGNLEHMAPSPLKILSTQRYAYGSFYRSLTAEQVGVIDSAAVRLFHDEGFDEPVVWEPSLALLDISELPGRLCAIEAVEKIRLDASANRKFGGTAADLGTSSLHVQLTLDLTRSHLAAARGNHTS